MGPAFVNVISLKSTGIVTMPFTFTYSLKRQAVTPEITSFLGYPKFVNSFRFVERN